jgi:hypothetical protein
VEESSGAEDTNASKRAESNPRSQQSAADSEEDPDLANADADEPASEASHKLGPDAAPYIDPGQLTVFDPLDGPSDERAG